MSGVGDSLPGCMIPSNRLAALRTDASHVLPSLLLCDFGCLAREIERLEAAGVPALHLDVMDGHFVPNLTYGLPIVSALRCLTHLPLDVHLMISNPGEYVERFIEAGADGVTVHAEALADPRPVLARIRGAGAAAGLAINPGTAVDAIRGYVDDCDLVLVMSVEPGFGGQAFNRSALGKLAALREMVAPRVVLEVDGGVNSDTIGDCVAAGAKWLVVGSAIFGASDYSVAVGQLNALAELS